MHFDANRLPDSKDDPTTRLTGAGFVGLFVCWRLFGDGMFAKAQILPIIEQDYVVNYRYSLYEQAKAEDKVKDSVQPSE
ncbi:MAG: hypothetical protein ACU84Q_14955 [Gammaproteobacteria bacterium]